MAEPFSNRLWFSIKTIALLIIIYLGVRGISRFIYPVPVIKLKSIKLSQVKTENIKSVVFGNGKLQPIDEHWVIARTSGIISEVKQREGDVVTEKTILMTLINPELNSRFQEALFNSQESRAKLISTKIESEKEQEQIEADLALAILELEAAKKLYEKRIISQIEQKKKKIRVDLLKQKLNHSRKYAVANIEVANIRIKQRESQTAKLKHQVSDLKIRSGVAGQIIHFDKNFHPGMSITVGETIARISSDNRLLALIRVPSISGQNLTEGMSVDIDSRKDVVRGTVEHINPSIEQDDMLIQVKLPDKLPKSFKTGLPVSATFEVSQQNRRLVIEKPSLSVKKNETLRLYKIDERQRKLIPVFITFGSKGLKNIVIEKGAVEGDWLVTSDMQLFPQEKYLNISSDSVLPDKRQQENSR